MKQLRGLSGRLFAFRRRHDAAKTAPSESTLERRRDERLRAVFGRERRTGLRLSLVARLAAFAVVGALIVFLRRDLAVLYYLAIVALFMAFGVGQMLLARRGLERPWTKYVFALADVALLTYGLLAPNPLDPVSVPPPLVLRGDGFLYFFLFLSLTVLNLSPWFVLWTGFASAAAWSLGTLWVIAQPGTKLDRALSSAEAHGAAARVARLLDPHVVDAGSWYQRVILLLVVSAILALVVARSHRLVRRQAAAERERGNLARYFSPNVVDDLASLDDPLGPVRRQKVAILFADIVGFSGFAEQAPPEEVIALLRSHHDRLGRIVFAHGGTLDKYIGDCLMATFGTPEPGLDDATRALRCARAMLASLEVWNRERAKEGKPPIRVGIGLHYGPVVLGNIGGERRLEFTVIGDAVNVASRLEALTRRLQVDLVASGALVEAVRRESGTAAEDVLEGLVEGPVSEVRGRDGRVRIWTLGGIALAPALAGE